MLIPDFTPTEKNTVFNITYEKMNGDDRDCEGVRGGGGDGGGMWWLVVVLHAYHGGADQHIRDLNNHATPPDPQEATAAPRRRAA